MEQSVEEILQEQQDACDQAYATSVFARALKRVANGPEYPGMSLADQIESRTMEIIAGDNRELEFQMLYGDGSGKPINTMERI